MINNPHDGIRAQRLLDRLISPAEPARSQEAAGIVRIASAHMNNFVTVTATLQAEMSMEDYLALITVKPEPAITASLVRKRRVRRGVK